MFEIFGTNLQAHKCAEGWHVTVRQTYHVANISDIKKMAEEKNLIFTKQNSIEIYAEEEF